MFKTYDYDVEMDARNHIIAHLDGKRCLIDTGCPVTIADGDVKFGDAAYKPSPQITEIVKDHGWDLNTIRKHGNLDIDALVGCDLLSTARWYVDPFQKTLTVGFLPKGRVVETTGRYNGSSPIIEAVVNGDKCEMLLDTGANVNFISKRYSEEWPVEGTHEDFYPTIGRFETTLRRAPFKAFGYQFGPTRFADLPEELDQAVEIGAMFGGPKMHGIAGMDILNHGSLGFDLRGGVVVFSPRES